MCGFLRDDIRAEKGYVKPRSFFSPCETRFCYFFFFVLEIRTLRPRGLFERKCHARPRECLRSRALARETGRGWRRNGKVGAGAPDEGPGGGEEINSRP